MIPLIIILKWAALWTNVGFSSWYGKEASWARGKTGFPKRLHWETRERSRSYPFMSASLPFSSSSNSLTDVYTELHRHIQPVALSWKTLTSFILTTKLWNVLTDTDFCVEHTRLMLSALWYLWSCKVLGIAVEINERRGVEPPRSPSIQKDAGGKCL